MGIVCVAHTIKHWHKRTVCYLELAKKCTHTQIAHTRHKCAQTRPVNPGFIYICMYLRTIRLALWKYTVCVCVCDCVLQYARYGSDAFSDTPCEFQFQSQQRNSQLTLPKLANHVREKHIQPSTPLIRFFSQIYLHPPSSPSLFLSHYQTGSSLPDQYPPVDQRRKE